MELLILDQLILTLDAVDLEVILLLKVDGSLTFVLSKYPP
jgi:hypothetical protein